MPKLKRSALCVFRVRSEFAGTVSRAVRFRSLVDDLCMTRRCVLRWYFPFCLVWSSFGVVVFFVVVVGGGGVNFL